MAPNFALGSTGTLTYPNQHHALRRGPSVLSGTGRPKVAVPIWGREYPSAGTGTTIGRSAGTGPVPKWDPTYIYYIDHNLSVDSPIN